MQNLKLYYRTASSPSKPTPRTLTRPELEEWLESLIDQRGEEGFRALREQVRALAPMLGLQDGLAELDPLMGAVLGARQVRASSPRLRARQKGFPYDANRVELFEALFDALDAAAPIVRPVLDPDAPRHRFLARAGHLQSALGLGREQLPVLGSVRGNPRSTMSGLSQRSGHPRDYARP